MRRFFLKAAVWGLLIAPFFALALGGFELFLRHHLYLLTGTFSCLRSRPVEPLWLLPNCRTTSFSPRGDLSYRTNEDGLRDRPRTTFAAGSVYVMGDSQVEGPWLREEETLSRRLEQEIGGLFLNVGLRGLGPTAEAIRTFRIRRFYPARAVVWTLNPTDPLDERYFAARTPGYQFRLSPPLMEVRGHFEGRSRIWFWLYQLNELFAFRLLSVSYVLDHVDLENAFLAAVGTTPFDEKRDCQSIKAATAAFKEGGAPVVFVALPHGPPSAHYPYFGIQPEKEEFEKLLACAASTGATVVRADREFDFSEDLFWEHDWHRNPAGEEKFAHYLAGKIGPLLGPQVKR